MSRFDITAWAFLLFFLPGLALWLGALVHDLVQVAVRRWRA